MWYFWVLILLTVISICIYSLANVMISLSFMVAYNSIVLHFLHPFIYWLTLRPAPLPGYFELGSDKHRCVSISVACWLKFSHMCPDAYQIWQWSLLSNAGSVLISVSTIVARTKSPSLIIRIIPRVSWLVLLLNLLLSNLFFILESEWSFKNTNPLG